MAVDLRSICKNFGDKQVLMDFDLVLEKGVTSIMGASGKGKTTIVNILSGLLVADKGFVNIPPATKFSFVFQEDRLLEWETALTNVLFVTENAKKNTARAVELLTEADLENNIHIKAKELSGGMKRRTAICRALIADYDIIVLDEPFKGLDANIKPRIIDMVKKHTKNKIVLVITHDKSEADYLGGRLVNLDD